MEIRTFDIMLALLIADMALTVVAQFWLFTIISVSVSLGVGALRYGEQRQ